MCRDAGLLAMEGALPEQGFKSARERFPAPALWIVDINYCFILIN